MQLEERTEEKPERHFRPDEIAEALGIKPGTVVGWIKKGIVHAVKLPGATGGYRVPAQECARVLAEWTVRKTWPEATANTCPKCGEVIGH